MASLGRPGEAGGGRGIASARHRAASGRGEEDDRRRWAGPRWAGPIGPPGGLRGERQVSALFYFLFVLFFLNLFCHCFEFKIIQTMPKTPLNIFILLDGLFQKLIKYFRGI